MTVRYIISSNKKHTPISPKMEQNNCKSKNAKLPSKNGSFRVLSGKKIGTLIPVPHPPPHFFKRTSRVYRKNSFEFLYSFEYKAEIKLELDSLEQRV